MNLYEISAEYQKLQELLLENGVELTLELQALWDYLGEEAATKLERAAHVLRGIDGEIDLLEAEIQRLQDRKKCRKLAHDKLRKLMLPTLAAIGGKLKTPLYTMSVQHRESWDIALQCGLDELEPRFVHTEVSLDRAAVTAALDGDESIPGIDFRRLTRSFLVLR